MFPVLPFTVLLAPLVRAGPVEGAATLDEGAVDDFDTQDLQVDPIDVWDQLVKQRPVIAAAIATREPDEPLQDAAARVLLLADPRLVDLLLPAVPRGPLPDNTGEEDGIDLSWVDLWLEGTVLHGVVAGRGVAQNGAWLDIDLGHGPTADLRLGFGRGWIRAALLDGAPPGSLAPVPDGRDLPVVEDDRVSFTFDLGALVPAVGSATARVQSLDGRLTDMGPGGIFGAPPEESLDVLLALVRAGPVTDVDLAVALAATFGSLRPLVADDALALVDADAAGWLQYGQALDPWLAERGAEWRFSDLDVLGKLTWAWPAAQGVVYGAVAIAGVQAPLNAEQYRFLVPDIATLEQLRDQATVLPSPADTARSVDHAINARLRYRTHGPLMESLCRQGALAPDVCEGWRLDTRAGADLGQLGGVSVPLWEAVSASRQAEVFLREGAYVGDCATATALTIASLQAVGIPAIGMGWSGQDYSDPTHDVPLWYDGSRFRGTQRGPGKAWATKRAFVYVTLPGVHPVNAFTLGREPGGWSRGGAVAGGWTTYREVERALREGMPAEVVGTWVDTQAAGGWPTW